MNTKTISAILATATGTVSILTATLGFSTSALANTRVFSCSAKNVYVEVSRLNNGGLRYAAYNIPTTLNRPNLLLNGGTVRRNQNGEVVYRFRNANYLYAAVQDQGYGKVLVYKNNRLIGTNYCGDV
jgi:aspartate 1-decarboxylase